MSSATDNRPPRVLISGAGISGLFLANLLEAANIPYEVYERAEKIQPLGSVISLSPNVLPAFEQLGLWEGLQKIASPSIGAQFYDADLKMIGEFSSKGSHASTGYHLVLFSRPDLYELLQSKIPPSKIHMSKKVTSFQQNQDGVTLEFYDGTTAQGDILVGADGAYSSVREQLFKDLNNKGKLPAEDLRKMKKGYICLVGTTTPLDITKFPGVDTEIASSTIVAGNKSCPYTWAIFSVPGNKICWNVVLQLDIDASNEEKFKNSEWANATDDDMIKEVSEFKTVHGKLGDLIANTPRERISRVFFENKLFQTWHHSRTVLVGDAAHKCDTHLLPSTGQGAVNAMLDSIILANCIYEMGTPTQQGIQDAFKEYYNQRFKYAKEQYAMSNVVAKLQFGHSIAERLLRFLAFNLIPTSFQRKQAAKGGEYRPQATFLPRAPKRGTGKLTPQEPSKRYQEVQEASQAPVSL
ncbi:hypothetical protein BGZ76_000944 [Entomortierella beljakovae]|nr:hypothetical protein BGZ76_000944 [Entomortierella beljakovae]